MELSVLLATAMLYGFSGFAFGNVMGIISEWNRKVAFAILTVGIIITGFMMMGLLLGSDPGTVVQGAAENTNWVGEVFLIIGTWLGVSSGEFTYNEVFA